MKCGARVSAEELDHDRLTRTFERTRASALCVLFRVVVDEVHHDCLTRTFAMARMLVYGSQACSQRFADGGALFACGREDGQPDTVCGVDGNDRARSDGLRLLSHALHPRREQRTTRSARSSRGRSLPRARSIETGRRTSQPPRRRRCEHRMRVVGGSPVQSVRRCCAATCCAKRASSR